MIVLWCRYSWSPASPNSRPKPDSLQPPNGVAGPSACEQFCHTTPERSAAATRAQRAASRVSPPPLKKCDGARMY